MIKILELARPDILSLKPYEHAAWQPTLERMHANEMPWRANGDDTRAGLNRYPEPQPREILDRLAQLYQVRREQVLVGRGSDEGIDLLIRAFCRAGQDRVLICPPTFGMYKVAARIQGADVLEVPLLKERGFALDENAVLRAAPDVKLIFLCTPNNPTANLLDATVIERLCGALQDRALIVVDEAYIEFAGCPSFAARIEEFQNLVVLRTLSKAYALAGARCGTVIAHPEIILLLARIIPPYALSTSTIETVLAVTDARGQAASQERIRTVLEERERLRIELARLPLIQTVWSSDSNFLLVDCVDADRVLNAAIDSRLIIRDPRSQRGLERSVRISVGTPEQNSRLLRGVAAASGVAA
ncbi:MAG TPA: histidinol-phosphate transaminase [Steroidobacteraceae bacterium]|nr:histidinol-phosphate transaminase [Steroidobacteraceae bacterium]